MKLHWVASGMALACLAVTPPSSASAAALKTGTPGEVQALSAQLSAVIRSLPANASEATFEAQLAAALDGQAQTCPVATAAVRETEGAPAPAHAREALSELLRAVARCGGGTGAIRLGAGALALGSSPQLGGGGGSDYVH